MRKDIKFIGKHDDYLEILYGKHIYQIEFNPPPPKISLIEKRIRDSETYDEYKENSCKIAKIENDETDSIGTCEEIYEEKEAKRKEKQIKNAHGILKFINRSKMSPDTFEDTDDVIDTEQDMWECKQTGLLIYTAKGVENRSMIAAYDLDGTLIKTKSGLVFPKDYDDWQIIYANVPTKLKKLYKDGYKIVIFTNQASFTSGKLNPDSFKNKLKNIIQKIGVPMQVFIATGYNIYRKPAIGMWQELEKKNSPISIDKDKSFYVGDTAGRAKNWAPGRKKDHSSVDRLLALNLNLKFYTPEEYFLDFEPIPYELPIFNPKNLSNKEICSGSNITSNDQEIILMVGCPGSGKSYFVKNYLDHYGYVNRDTLGSWKKCVTVMEKYLDEKSSVVIDNTNPDCVSRQRYIEVAKKYNIPVRCFVMTTSIDHAKHNNKFRELTDPSHAKVNDVIINSYVKNFQQPSLEEGFKEIVDINFVPKFQKEEDRRLYEMYLLER